MCKQIKSQNLYFISEDYKATGDCRLYLGDDFGESHVALAVQKDSTAFSHFTQPRVRSLMTWFIEEKYRIL